MQKIKERRREKRLHYELPVWINDDPNKESVQAVMVDISSSGMAFICDADGNCPSVNQQLTLQFSIPRFGTSSSDMQQITRNGSVFRIDDLNDGRHRVAIKFDDPPFWNLPPESDR